MSSSTADTTPVDVFLRPAFVLGLLLFAALLYSVVVLQRVLLFLWGAAALASIGLTVLVVWLLYRLVVAVEDVAETAGRIEASLDDE